MIFYLIFLALIIVTAIGFTIFVTVPVQAKSQIQKKSAVKNEPLNSDDKYEISDNMIFSFQEEPTEASENKQSIFYDTQPEKVESLQSFKYNEPSKIVANIEAFENNIIFEDEKQDFKTRKTKDRLNQQDFIKLQRHLDVLLHELKSLNPSDLNMKQYKNIYLQLYTIVSEYKELIRLQQQQSQSQSRQVDPSLTSQAIDKVFDSVNNLRQINSQQSTESKD